MTGNDTPRKSTKKDPQSWRRQATLLMKIFKILYDLSISIPYNTFKINNYLGTIFLRLQAIVCSGFGNKGVAAVHLYLLIPNN